jgi:hypothetical protein
MKTTKESIKEKKRIVHVIRRADGWAVRKHGADRATKIYQNKKEAVRDAQKLKRNGSIQKWEESEKGI